MVLIEILAIFLCGTFFGAAIYISMAQHPATMKTGIPFAIQFFPPMYDLASRLQIALAVGGTLAGVMQWYLVRDPLWAVGAALLFFVIPFTIIILKPINDQLLDSNANRSDSDTEDLLNRWAPRHWLRSIASGMSFVVYLFAGVAS